jgi:hypothetical protein
MRRHILTLVENLSVPADRRVWESRADTPRSNDNARGNVGNRR